MQLGRIVLRIRTNNTTFGSNVFGGAELALVVNNTLTANKPVAFVIPLEDDCTANIMDSNTIQLMIERFAVIVAVRTDYPADDETGLVAFDSLHDIRDELFSTLIGYDLGYEGPIYYRRGKLLGIDRAYMWYQFEFEYTSRIVTNTDGFGEIETNEVDDPAPVSSLPDFNQIYTQYILSPSVKLREIQNDPAFDLPVEYLTPDLTQLIDLTEYPGAGAFSDAFFQAFDFYIRQEDYEE